MVIAQRGVDGGMVVKPVDIHHAAESNQGGRALAREVLGAPPSGSRPLSRVDRKFIAIQDYLRILRARSHMNKP